MSFYVDPNFHFDVAESLTLHIITKILIFYLIKFSSKSGGSAEAEFFLIIWWLIGSAPNFLRRFSRVRIPHIHISRGAAQSVP